MTLRCPYCARTFGRESLPRCPGCGRILRVPEPLQARPLRERRRAREKIAHEAEGRRAAGIRVDAAVFRRPGIVVGVLLMMALLGALIASRARQPPPRRPDRRLVALSAVQTLRTAVERFRADCGRYPTRAEGLRALVLDPGEAAWRGPYVNLVKSDPWEVPYRYEAAGSNVAVFSCGPDRRPGTADDLLADPPDREDAEAWLRTGGSHGTHIPGGRPDTRDPQARPE